MDGATQLDWIYGHERERPDAIWLSQPMGAGAMRDFTFAAAMREVRCMAAHLRSLELPAGSCVAIFSKNTAWWLLADLAIWMAGHVTVPIYPTLTPKSIRAILEHSEARVCLIGKLDGFAAMESGLPDGIVRLLLPLAPKEAAREGVRTGDRGEIDASGALAIRGRVKELFKTSKGKYVAPAPLESALLAHPEIDQACVSGVGLPQPYALIVLSAALRARPEANRAEIATLLERHLREVNAAFDPHERLDKLLVVPEEWTTENGLLTPTLKLRRAIIEERYAERIPKLLEHEGRVVWVGR